MGLSQHALFRPNEDYSFVIRRIILLVSQVRNHQQALLRSPGSGFVFLFLIKFHELSLLAGGSISVSPSSSKYTEYILQAP